MHLHIFLPSNMSFCGGTTKQVLLIWVLLMGGCFCAHAIANEQAKHQESIKNISAKINAVSSNLNANKKLLKSERHKLAELEQKIVTLNRNQQDTQTQILRQKRRLQRLKEDAAGLITDQQANLAALSALFNERYKEGVPNMFQMLFNQENPHAVGRLENYYRYFSEAQRTKIESIKAALSKVEKIREEQANIYTDLDKQNRKLTRQQKQLQSSKEQRNKRISRLDGQVLKSEDLLKKLTTDRERLNALLKEVVANAAELARIESERRSRTIEPNSRPNRTPLKGGFKNQQGRLSPPVVADFKYKFGSRLAASGMRAQGHFYSTQSLQPVSSIFRGQVIFADYLKGYGLLIIIDHGDEHISLYGHNEVLYKQVSDPVSTGETIATSGRSGGLKQPGLYFEIRHNAAPIDPGRWLRRG